VSTSAPLIPVPVEANALIAFVALKTGKRMMIVFSVGSLRATSEFRNSSSHPEVPEQLLAVLKSSDLMEGEYRLPICLAEDAASTSWYTGSPLDAVLTLHAVKPDSVQYIDLSVGIGNCLSLVPQKGLGQPMLAIP
jgi:hypothetical protein